MNDNEKGKEIFLAQLRKMAEGYKTMEECVLDDVIPVNQAEAFGVAGDLREAFYAYHAEFLNDHETSTNTSGPFYNDEDVNEGIRKKFWYFYWPIVNLIEKKYSSFKCTLTIEPCYQDCSTILVLAENRYGENKLPFPVVILWEAIKAWYMPFDKPEEPSHVFAYLNDLYNSMEQVCSVALRIFDITNSADEENVSIPKMLKDLAETAVNNMGDVFYDPDEFKDYRYGLDEGEEPRGGDSANQRLIRNVTECVSKALTKAYSLGCSIKESIEEYIRWDNFTNELQCPECGAGHESLNTFVPMNMNFTVRPDGAPGDLVVDMDEIYYRMRNTDFQCRQYACECGYHFYVK